MRAALVALVAAACSHAASAPAGGPGFDEVCATAELRRQPDAGVRALLADSDPRARARAALAAGRIADPAAIPALRALLADPAAAPAAAWALGRTPGGEVALLECLATATSTPTSTSTPTPTSTSTPTPTSTSTSSPFPTCAASVEAARALGFGPRGDAVPGALARALAGPADLSAAAATALGVLARTGGKGADAAVAAAARLGLEAALRSTEPAVRAGAVYALGRITRVAAPPALAAVLRDREPETRALAARAWGRQGGPAEELSPLLRDADWRVRVEAARALALVPGGPAAIETALPPAAADLAQRDSAAARWAHPLIALLESAPAAHLAAGSLPAPSSLSGPTAASTAAARCAAALARDRIAGRIGATPGCAAGLEPDWRGRMRTGVLAAELAERDPEARAKAAVALRDADGRVRGAVAGAAGAVLADELRRLLDDPDPFVVAEAAGSLAKDPALAAGSIPAAVRAVQRLGAARSRPAGDAESDALASLAQLLGAADARAAEVVPVLLSLQAVGSAYLHRALADALRALRAPPPRGAPPSPAVPAEAAQGLPGSPARPRLLRLRTTAGDLAFALRSAGGEAPLTSAAIGALSRRGFYADLSFHRVVPDFVAQGGDPRGDGDGGPGWALPDEHTPLRFVRGSVGIATNGPETGGSQLFVCHSAQPHLDGRYTLFAELRDGAAAMDALQVGDRILEASSE